MGHRYSKVLHVTVAAGLGALMIAPISQAHAGPLQDYFRAIKGNWTLKAGMSHSLNAQGGIDSTSIYEDYLIEVSGGPNRWNMIEQSCSRDTNENETMCADGVSKWVINGTKLSMVIDRTVPVKVITSTATKLVYTYSSSGTTWLQSESLNGQVWSRSSIADGRDGTRYISFETLTRPTSSELALPENR